MIIIVHVFYNFAVALRIMTGYWSAVGFHGGGGRSLPRRRMNGRSGGISGCR